MLKLFRQKLSGHCRYTHLIIGSAFFILDHIRKLKNRVAAQTARDRKKAHLDTMEETLGMTQLANQELMKENEILRQENERLAKENQELRKRLGLVSDAEMVCNIKFFKCVRI